MILNKFFAGNVIHKQFLIFSIISNLVLTTGQNEEYSGNQYCNQNTNIVFTNPEFLIPDIMTQINTGYIYNEINPLNNNFYIQSYFLNNLIRNNQLFVNNFQGEFRPQQNIIINPSNFQSTTNDSEHSNTIVNNPQNPCINNSLIVNSRNDISSNANTIDTQSQYASVKSDNSEHISQNNSTTINNKK